tara:strand:+ start:593 stop:1018 length:426 start_codon:yes stop_codon:yes gene_type:complete
MAREFKLGKEIEGTWLTPIRFAEMRHWPKVSYYLFRCRCGNEKVLRKGNVRAQNTKSCGCLGRKNEKDFVKKWSGAKGKIPWNKGLKGMRSYAKGNPNLAWKKGRIKITGADGSIEWVKVSDESIGSHSEHYKLKQQLGIT